jgi:acyl-CoA thioesterase
MPLNTTFSANHKLLFDKASNEPIATFLNMRLIELAEGYAKVSMKLTKNYLNFNGLIFGGIIMALADEAFAYATNSVISPNLASQFNIHFISGAKEGEELIAECKVLKKGKRVCIAEISILNSADELIAKASGTTIPVVKT